LLFPSTSPILQGMSTSSTCGFLMMAQLLAALLAAACAGIPVAAATITLPSHHVNGACESSMGSPPAAAGATCSPTGTQPRPLPVEVVPGVAAKGLILLQRHTKDFRADRMQLARAAPEEALSNASTAALLGELLELRMLASDFAQKVQDLCKGSCGAEPLPSPSSQTAP